MATCSAAHPFTKRPRRRLAVGALLGVISSLVMVVTVPLGARPAAASATVDAAVPGSCTAGLTTVPTASPGQDSALDAIDATSGSDVWAVGRVKSQDSQGYGPYAVHGTASQMDLVPIPQAPGTDTSLEGVATPHPGSAWIAGTTGPEDATRILPFVAHWNGVDVTAETLPASATDGRRVFDTSIDAWSDTDVWFVGTDEGTPGSPQGYALHRRGDTWSDTPVPGATSLDTVHAVGPEEAYAGGQGLWHWNGAVWAPVAVVPRTSTVVDITGSAGDVTVLYSDGYTGPHHLVHSDGTSWSELALPALRGVVQTSYISMSQAPDGTLWALLRATFRGSPPDSRYVLARRTGSTWVTFNQGDGDALGQSEGDIRYPEHLVALSGDDLRTSGSAVAQADLPAGTNSGSVLRLCGPSIGPTSVARPQVSSSLGASFLVFGEPGLTGRRTVSDDLGLVQRKTVRAGDAVRLGYPAAGTFTATVTRPGAGAGDTGTTIRTLVGLQTSGTRIRWADAPLPQGYVTQVQVQRPGAAGFHLLQLANPTDISVVLARTAPPGTYHYRARVVRTVDGVASGWSPVLTVVR